MVLKRLGAAKRRTVTPLESLYFITLKNTEAIIDNPDLAYESGTKNFLKLIDQDTVTSIPCSFSFLHEQLNTFGPKGDNLK